MKKITYFALLMYSITGYCQNYQWLKTVPINTVNSFTAGYVTVCDPNGNIYMTGFQDNPLFYNDILGNIFYNKYNTNGDIIFSK